MDSSRKTLFLIILLFATVLNGSPIFGAQAVEAEEKFKILRLASNLERAVSSDENDKFTSTFTPCDQRYFDEMAAWHRAATEELRVLDPQVNHSGDKSGYRNLCLLRISVVYKDGESLKKRDVIFKDDIFLSGRDLSKLKPQNFAIGQVELSSNPFTVTLEPGYRDDRLPNLTTALGETFHSVLTHSDQADKLSLKLKKRVISIDDFYPPQHIFDYEQSIIELFEFQSILNEAGKKDLRRAFEATFKSKLPPSSLLDVSKVILTAGESLDKALLVLPFNTASNERSMKYFQQTADVLFQGFKGNFCDSEQAIRLFIRQERENKALWKALAFDEKDSPLNVKQIEQIYINIASIRYMCPICQGTYLYDIKEKGNLHRGILRAILSAQKQDLSQVNALLGGPRVIVYVSGIKPTSKEK